MENEGTIAVFFLAQTVCGVVARQRDRVSE